MFKLLCWLGQLSGKVQINTRLQNFDQKMPTMWIVSIWKTYERDSTQIVISIFFSWKLRVYVLYTRGMPWGSCFCESSPLGAWWFVSFSSWYKLGQLDFRSWDCSNGILATVPGWTWVYRCHIHSDGFLCPRAVTQWHLGPQIERWCRGILQI